MDKKNFKVGYIVTRTGIDEQEILEIDEDFFCMTVKCIKEPVPFESGDKPYMAIGETEYNLCDRYSFVRHKE